MTTAITEFTGPYRFLSNFWPLPQPYRLDGHDAPTVEHAFQAYKSVHVGERVAILQAKTPGQAKRLGRRVTLRRDWEQVKDKVMLHLVRHKFAQSPLREQLLATGEAELIEGNTWGDRYWGVCQGTGQNKLGHILMRVRDELRHPASE